MWPPVCGRLLAGKQLPNQGADSLWIHLQMELYVGDNGKENGSYYIMVGF